MFLANGGLSEGHPPFSSYSFPGCEEHNPIVFVGGMQNVIFAIFRQNHFFSPASPSVTFGVSFSAVFLGYSLCT